MKRALYLLVLGLGSLALMSSDIDLRNLFNYSNQEIPNYITKDNTGNNSITDEGATLGRVLFYDVKLSSDNTVACASCHKQEFAFGDNELVSQGVNGTTGRHSMRLVNSRFAREAKFFWYERASSLEQQTTMPIKDHGEMGYSGSNGDPEFADLIDKLQETDYYKELFYIAFGDTRVSEDRMQLALAQFIRSIQSFDSKFDEGRRQVNNANAPFPNFTNDENSGKALFRAPPQFDQTGSRIGGGLGCNGCHTSPEFDIDPNSQSNSVINKIGSEEYGYSVTRAPSLRDLFNSNGELNGPLMHTGEFSSLEEALEVYNNVDIPDDALANLIDRRLRPPGANTQRLNMTETEKSQLIAFLKTLTGSDIYTNEMWSSPFNENGELTLLGSDIDAPEVLTQDILIDLDEDGIANIEAQQIDYGTEGEDLTFELNKYNFTCIDIGDNEVILTVTNRYGKSSSNTAIVTVVDIQKPIVLTKNINLDLNSNSEVSINADDINNGTVDNCEFELSLDTYTFDKVGEFEVTLMAEDASGNISSEKALVKVEDSVLGIETNEDVIRIYPNPVSNFLNIETNEEILNFMIFDINGNMVFNTNKKSIDVSGISSGIYYIKVKTISEQIINQKFVKVD